MYSGNFLLRLESVDIYLYYEVHPNIKTQS